MCICGNAARIAEGQRESTPPSAEERTGAVAVLLHHQPSAQLIHPAPHRWEKKNWSFGSIIPSSAISWTYTLRPSRVREIHHQLNHTLRPSQLRVVHQQLRRELELWQYYSIISHQLNSYTPPLTVESNPPSAAKKTGAVAVLLHNQSKAKLIHSAPHRWE